MRYPCRLALRQPLKNGSMWKTVPVVLEGHKSIERYINAKFIVWSLYPGWHLHSIRYYEPHEQELLLLGLKQVTRVTHTEGDRHQLSATYPREVHA